MKPLAFKKPSFMSDQPLRAEKDELRNVLATLMPPEVSGPRQALADLRAVRSSVEEEFRRGCLAHLDETSNNNAPLPKQLRDLEDQIKVLNDQVAVLRIQADEARLRWTPEALRKVKPYLKAAEPAIEQAIALLESAAELHEVADDYMRLNNLNAWIAPRSRRLLDLCASLKRFLGPK